MWSAFIFIGYNILTAAEATTEEGKDEYDYDSYEEYNEIVEPLCNDKGGKLNYGDGYCYFDERDKELQFEKELDDRGLGADYTAEEEASWNQKEKTGFLREGYDWDEFYDDNVSRERVEEACDASEDYLANEKACDKAYQKIERQEEISKEVQEEGVDNLAREEEIAAQEDALCDNEDADTTNIKKCMSEDRKNNQQQKNNEREWYYNENTNQYEYLSDEEIKEHNMEAESEIMQGEKWGPETPIEPPSEPYPTTTEEEDIHKAWAEANEQNTQQQEEDLPNVVSSNFENEEVKEEEEEEEEESSSEEEEEEESEEEEEESESEE